MPRIDKTLNEQNETCHILSLAYREKYQGLCII